MGLIVYNNKRSDDYGIKVWSAPNYEMPAKDIERYHVPGRSGDILVDSGSYQNMERTYTISSGSDSATFKDLARQISDWLNYSSGYSVLEDDYEPDVYRMAIYSGTDPITNVLDHAAMIGITFTCKPQRFLKTGDNKITITSNGYTLNNPYPTTALPIITVKGSGQGSITVAGYEVSFSSLSTTGVTVNCADQECYTGSTSKNSTVSLGATGFPKLAPGNSVFTISGGVTSVEVLPKWWII